MGGLEGLVRLGDAASEAPRVGVVVRGASHCHLYVPIGSECDFNPRNDVGGVGAAGRFFANAFLHAYLAPSGGAGAGAGDPGEASLREKELRKKRNAVDIVWGGSRVFNRAGIDANPEARPTWNARVLTEPRDLKLALRPRSRPGYGSGGVGSNASFAFAAYGYDSVRDAWTATVPIEVTPKRPECLTEVRVVASESGSERSVSPLRAFLDANGLGVDRRGSSSPAQPAGSSVIAFPNAIDSERPNRPVALGLVLEWRSGSVDTRGRAETRTWDSIGSDPTRGRRLLGGDREARDETLEPLPGTVFVTGTVAWPPLDPVAEVMIRAQGFDDDIQRRSETPLEIDVPETVSSFAWIPETTVGIPRVVRVRALDSCDGGTATFLNLRVAPPRLERADAIEETAGAFGATDRQARSAEDVSRETRPNAEEPSETFAARGRTRASSGTEPTTAAASPLRVENTWEETIRSQKNEARGWFSG